MHVKVGYGLAFAEMVICTVNLLSSRISTHIICKPTGAGRRNHYLLTSFMADFGIKRTDLPSPFSDSISKVHCAIFFSD